MVKVLIYSSRELYDTSSFEGRAEADLIAYRIDDYDCAVVKIDLLKIFGYVGLVHILFIM